MLEAASIVNVWGWGVDEDSSRGERVGGLVGRKRLVRETSGESDLNELIDGDEDGVSYRLDDEAVLDTEREIKGDFEDVAEGHTDLVTLGDAVGINTLWLL